jgi:hypothetical protein
MDRRFLLSLLVSIALISTALWMNTALRAQPQPQSTGSSIRFFGTGAPDLDRVKIPLGDSSGSLPVNVSADLTVEFWIKPAASNNQSDPCGEQRGWYYGHVLVDRDVFGDADHFGDYGISLMGGRIIAGLNTSGGETHLCSTRTVSADLWQHIAFTRNATTGTIQLFIDGEPAGSKTGPLGRLDYDLDYATNFPQSDPFLVLAAEKHDFEGSLFYAGLMDDLRISDTVRYQAAFERPTAPHPADAATVALYRFDEAAGTQISDSAPASGGPSNGLLIPRHGNSVAEHWSSDTPFQDSVPTNTPTTTPTNTPTTTPASGEPTTTPTHTPTTAPTNTPTPKPHCANQPTSSVPGEPTPTLVPLPVPAPEERIFLPLLTCQ